MKNNPWGDKCNILSQRRGWLVVELRQWKKKWTDLKYRLEAGPVVLNNRFGIGGYGWREKLRGNQALAPETQWTQHVSMGHKI